MDKREQNMSLIRKIAGAAFGISFLMAIVLFTGYGREYVSIKVATLVFIGTGAIGLFLNLVTFQSGKHHPIYNFVYWGGSIILFVGMVFLLMRWPYGYYIIVTGLVALGTSFFLPSQLSDSKPKDSGLLDD